MLTLYEVTETGRAAKAPRVPPVPGTEKARSVEQRLVINELIILFMARIARTVECCQNSVTVQRQGLLNEIEK